MASYTSSGNKRRKYTPKKWTPKYKPVEGSGFQTPQYSNYSGGVKKWQPKTDVTKEERDIFNTYTPKEGDVNAWDIASTYGDPMQFVRAGQYVGNKLRGYLGQTTNQAMINTIQGGMTGKAYMGQKSGIEPNTSQLAWGDPYAGFKFKNFAYGLYRSQNILPQRWVGPMSYEGSRGWQRERRTNRQYSNMPTAQTPTTPNYENSLSPSYWDKFWLKNTKDLIGEAYGTTAPIQQQGYGGGGGYYPYEYGGGGGYTYNAVTGYHPQQGYNYTNPYAEYRRGYAAQSAPAQEAPTMRRVSLPYQPTYRNNATYPARWMNLLVSWRI